MGLLRAAVYATISAVLIGCGVTTDPALVCGAEKTYNHEFNIIPGGDINSGIREITLEGPLEPSDICSREGHVTPDSG